MAQLPYYVPDDDHFYQTEENIGNLQRQYQDSIGQNNAETTQAIGQMGANAIQNLPNNAMRGADWAMNRGQNQQRYNINAAEENRTEQRFPVEMEGSRMDNALRQQGLARGDLQNNALQRRASFDQGKISPTNAKRFGFDPGMTNEQMGWALPSEESYLNMQQARTGMALSGAQLNAANYGLAHQKLEDMGGSITPDASPQMGTVSQPGPVARPSAPGMQLTGGIMDGIPSGRPSQSPGKVAAQADGQLSDAQAASIAESLGGEKMGITPALVKETYRQKQLQKAAASTQAAQAGELFRDTAPQSRAARDQATRLSSEVSELKSVLDAAKQYNSQADIGNDVESAIASHLGSERGWAESQGQKGLREAAIRSLQNAKAYGEAASLSGGGIAKMQDRISSAAAAALARKQQEVNALLDSNSQYANDPVLRNLKAYVDKLANDAGVGVPRLVGAGSMPAAPQMTRAFWNGQ